MRGYPRAHAVSTTDVKFVRQLPVELLPTSPDAFMMCESATIESRNRSHNAHGCTDTGLRRISIPEFCLMKDAIEKNIS